MRTRATDALDRLLELTVLLGQDMAAGLARDGLTESRAHLLWVLGETGPSPQRPLAQALGVTPRTVTGLVDGLVETGFVTREPHPTDRRAALVTPTAKGVAAVASLTAGRAELARQLFGDVPPAEAERFVATMDGVLDRLRAAIAADAEARS
ncbi:MarR family winged helix-turn-helix transcriptional regulator [Solicola sp. PLA-1-18]|uniref:MarR family winged helix-turn-helix transcriptional regulator n=1 Tax=Solicola sp. PLA-1-18 TaxID=3380532 RepID=UPI003B7D8264